MADIDIKAVYSWMLKCAETLEAIGDSVKIAYGDMDDFLNKKLEFNGKSVYANWQSDARTVFAEKAQVVIDMFNTVHKECYEASTTLRKAINLYEERDADIGRTFKKIEPVDFAFIHATYPDSAKVYSDRKIADPKLVDIHKAEELKEIKWEGNKDKYSSSGVVVMQQMVYAGPKPKPVPSPEIVHPTVYAGPERPVEPSPGAININMVYAGPKPTPTPMDIVRPVYAGLERPVEPSNIVIQPITVYAGPEPQNNENVARTDPNKPNEPFQKVHIETPMNLLYGPPEILNREPQVLAVSTRLLYGPPELLNQMSTDNTLKIRNIGFVSNDTTTPAVSLMRVESTVYAPPSNLKDLDIGSGTTSTNLVYASPSDGAEKDLKIGFTAPTSLVYASPSASEGVEKDLKIGSGTTPTNLVYASPSK